MNRTISVTQFRASKGATFDAVRNDKQTITVTSKGLPRAVLMAADEYERLLRDRQEMKGSTRPRHDRA